jgi:hypothetical protein
MNFDSSNDPTNDRQRRFVIFSSWVLGKRLTREIKIKFCPEKSLLLFIVSYHWVP